MLVTRKDKLAFSLMVIGILLISANVAIFAYNEFKTEEIEISDQSGFPEFKTRTEGYNFVFFHGLDDSYRDRMRPYFAVNLINLTTNKTYLLELSGSGFSYPLPYVWLEDGSLWNREDFYLPAECTCYYLFVLWEILNPLNKYYIGQNLKVLDFLIIDNSNSMIPN